jgi:signal transduction histidine kinase
LLALTEHSFYRAEFQTRTLRAEERRLASGLIVCAQSHGQHDRLTRGRTRRLVVVTFFDITDRKKLEEQILQSQKMESLGRFAGGIAHDFNNLLMVISGYSDLLLHNLDKPDALERGLSEIRRAGERGAELTQQLAFSRRQPTQPRAMDRNALIRESQGMLQRAIGEDIDLAISLDPVAWTIRADRGQMHQVLMNLVVSGRQAMTERGVLTIETANEVYGDPQVECLLLRIRDTGIGMDESTRRHAFEPFFTTKRAAKGTGLGLATVFGIVTQAGGHITVESELDTVPGSASTCRDGRVRRPRKHRQGGNRRLFSMPARCLWSRIRRKFGSWRPPSCARAGM